MNLIVSLPAEQDISEAFDWYQIQMAGLGDRFLMQVDRTLLNIQASFDLYPILYRDIRRALVRQFPYAVYYCRARDSLVIVAVLHQRQNPVILHNRH
jgi:plasmid stabilization system protein ParE